MLQIQAQKLDQLISLQITSDSSPESHKNVVVPWPRETSFHYRYYISLYCHSQRRRVSWPSNIFSINALLRNGPKPELYGRYYYCIGATSSSRMDRMELTQFITAVNSFHLALKYTWEISYTFLAFLDIKISIEGNGLCASLYYKPTDSQPVNCRIHLRIHHTLRITFLFHSFSDFVVYVVTTLVFPEN